MILIPSEYLLCLQVFVIFLSPSRRISLGCLKICQYCFHPYTSGLIFYIMGPFLICCLVL